MKKTLAEEVRPEQELESQRIDNALHEIEDEEIEESEKGLDSLKAGEQILKDQVRTSLTEYRRNSKSLFISSFSAGLEVGFSVLLMGTLYTTFGDRLSEGGMGLALALAYPIGFVFVIIGRSELFTEHTTLAVLPVLNRTVGITNLLRLWAIVFVGNLLGGYLFSFILVKVGPGMGTVSLDAIHHIAEEMTQYNWWLTLSSGIFAGWLMGLLSWLIASSRDTISRILVIILVTSVIGICGLHHSIVGSIEVFSGFISSPNVTLSDYFHFQLWATVGNIIGGTVFVAILKYGQLGDQISVSRSR